MNPYQFRASGAASSDAFAGIWLIVSIVVAIIGGITLFFTFLKKSNDGKFKGFAGWLYDFLTFKKMLIENLLRIMYLICTIFITLFSFAIISENFLAFLIVLVVGNLLFRIIYEFSLILLVICRNTTDINSKLSNHKLVPEDKQTEKIDN